MGAFLRGLLPGIVIVVVIYGGYWLFIRDNYNNLDSFSSPHTMMIQGEEHEVRYDIDWYYGSDERAYTVKYDDTTLWFVVKEERGKHFYEEPITNVLMRKKDLIVFATATEGFGVWLDTYQPISIFEPRGEPNGSYYDNYLFEISQELLPQIHQAIWQR